MSAPLVSVVIPVFNGAGYLEGAVHNALRQGYRPLEVIVVDDGSTDGTSAVAARLGDRIRYLHKPNGGAASARNHGVRASRGDVLAFLDVDDLWPLGKLEAQVPRLSSPDEVDLVMGQTRWVSIDDAIDPGDLAALEALPATVAVGPFLGSMVVRREAFERTGAFDESYQVSEDLDWLIRAREIGLRITVLDRVTLIYRQRAGSLTKSRPLGQFQLARALKRSLDRRRAESASAAPLDALRVEAPDAEGRT